MGFKTMAVIILVVSGCQVPHDGDIIRAVENQGYRNAGIISRHRFFPGNHGCANEDTVAYEMGATNIKGQWVKLIACAGNPYMGVTIRSR